MRFKIALRSRRVIPTPDVSSRTREAGEDLLPLSTQHLAVSKQAFWSDVRAVRPRVWENAGQSILRVKLRNLKARWKCCVVLLKQGSGRAHQIAQHLFGAAG